MRYSPEEIFKKFINSVLSDASLDFFVKRAAVFLSMMMPVSSLFIFRSVEGSITKLAECNKTPAINISDHFAISPESMTRLRTENTFQRRRLQSENLYRTRNLCVRRRAPLCLQDGYIGRVHSLEV